MALCRRLRTIVWLAVLLPLPIASDGGVQVRLYGPAPVKRHAQVSDGARRAIVIDIDGLKRDVLYGMLAHRPEEIPNISYLVGNVTHDSLADDYEFLGAAGVNRATTIIPSVTLPSQLAILTGRWPKHHGIPANAWFSRRLGRPIDIIALVEGLLGGILTGEPTAPTILDVAAAQGYTAAFCFDATACQLDAGAPPLGISIDPVAFDTAMTTAVLRLVNRVGIPRLLIVYYPGNDVNSHANGADSQEAYLRDVVDPLIGRLLNGDPIALKGEAEPLDGFMDLDPNLISNTMFVFCADHGHIDVDTRPDHAIGTTALNGPLGTVGYMIGDNAAYQPNGGSGLVYLKNRLTQRWVRPSVWRDVLPAARAIANSQATLGNFLDFLLVRVNARPDGRAYRVLDPDTGRVHTLRAFFSTRSDDYPDAVRRIIGTDPEKLGDIILFPNRDEGYNFAEGPSVRSDHGSLLDTESYVPLIFSGAGAAAKTIRHARNIDIAPTIAQALRLRFAWRRADGRRLPIAPLPW